MRQGWMGVALYLFSAVAAAAQTGQVARPVNVVTEVVVVVNDASPDSVTLGDYYATARGIPTSQICHLNTVTTETCTWNVYRTQIETPLRTFLTTRPQVIYIVMMYGLPLKTIEENPGNDIGGDYLTNRDYCAIDREVELIKTAHAIEGWIVNPMFGAGRHPVSTDPFYVVGRLDGPTPALVQAMIDNALYGEANGVTGDSLLDTRGLSNPNDPYTLIDLEMKNIESTYQFFGIPYTHDDLSAVVDLAMRPDQAHYWGWYTTNAVISAPTWQFNRGAVGAHLHSFSASTVRSTTSNWVGPLVYHGITGTCGTVYEPYSVGFPYGTVALDRFFRGYTLGAAMQMANNYTSWMAVFIGDPLYAPYAADVIAARQPPPVTGPSDPDPKGAGDGLFGDRLTCGAGAGRIGLAGWALLGCAALAGLAFRGR